MVTIIDYGMGNLKSVHKAFEYLDIPCEVTQDYKKTKGCDKLVFPGVGAFGDCIGNLQKLNLFDAMIEFIHTGKPFLGICLGLQALFDHSNEEGHHSGLSVLSGTVVRFEHQLKIPHMGWNKIHFEENQACPMLSGIENGSYMYFVHSYYAIPQETGIIAATTDYGTKFTSMVWKDNIYAVQFHPEKSQRSGLKMLKNFGNI